jgi:tetratricopeptide (TPR) repeat protein
MAMFYSGNFSEAIKLYEDALIVNPNHQRVINDLATSYEREGNRDEAIKYYRQALSITPLFIEANLNISAAYFNKSSIDSAYYYIDRIYKREMSWGEESNYNKFLAAILYAKAFNIIKSKNDSIFFMEHLPLIDNDQTLKRLYQHSKVKNQPFAKILEDSLFSVKK